MHLAARPIAWQVLVTLAFLLPLNLFGQAEEYVRVNVRATDQQVAQMAAAGIATDHLGYTADGISGEFNAWEMQKIQQLGLSYSVIHSDAAAWYAARNANASLALDRDGAGAVPYGFHLGSMGGCLTFDEAVADLDSMALWYPNLVTAKDSIGVSHEGRTIWMLKISDNPQLDENEPEVLYVGLHHAREPMSLMNLMYFMFHVLEQYGSDPAITHLLNTRELYFVPVLNPDGYVYNQTTNPNGGGLWRKNRRNNGNNSYGVDLNRNYSFEWAHDNFGSSYDPLASNYRGPSAFSEPETQALRQFCMNRKFRTAFSPHAWGEQCIHPWGYNGTVSLQQEEERLHRYGHFLTESSDYTPGNADQTIGYPINGSSDDWMLGEVQDKEIIRSFSPEIGNNIDWFWPPVARIVPLCEEMLEANMRIACLAGACLEVIPAAPCDIEGSEAWLPVRFANIGLDTADAFSAQFITADPNVVAVPVGLLNLGSMPDGQTITDSFRVSLAANIAPGTMIKGAIRTTLPGNAVTEDSIYFRYGIPEVIFEDGGESGLTAWAGTWALTDEKVHSGNYSITESPQSFYAPSASRSLVLTTPLDLEMYTDVRLEFFATWQVETNWDYVTVEASENGFSYQPLTGKYTRPGSGNNQPSGEPVFEGNRFFWVKEKIDLSDYDGRNLFLRFRFNSNAFQERDGFYFDDLKITGYKTTVGQNPSDPFADLDLLPNPASQQAHLYGRASGAENLELELVSLQGQILQTEQVNPGSSVDLSRFSAGVYFYRFRNNGDASPLRKLVLY